MPVERRVGEAVGALRQRHPEQRVERDEEEQDQQEQPGREQQPRRDAARPPALIVAFDDRRPRLRLDLVDLSSWTAVTTSSPRQPAPRISENRLSNFSSSSALERPEDRQLREELLGGHDERVVDERGRVAAHLRQLVGDARHRRDVLDRRR